MPTERTCSECGAGIPSEAREGLCTRCLFTLGLKAGAATQSPEAAGPPVAGTSVRYFGDYELLEQVGRGGMGIVYKAQQRSLNRIVALKMISAGEFASPAAVQRFQIEAEAAAKLDHPNIVPIYEIGVHRGQHYFSMKFVEGRSLAEEIRTGKFRFSTDGNPPGKAADRERQSAVARLMTTVAHSVHYAHQHGVVHRDLKPSNILLDADGQPYLTDFGLAKILEHGLGITQSAETMGTPSYMSPEQATGRPLTTATDVYSLGAILYELLTGRPPFLGPSAMEVLQQLAGQEPVPPESLNPAANRDLATICLKCLEKDPVKRYASTEHLADELVRFRKDEPIQARPVSQREKAWRWCRRKPALAISFIIILVVALAGITGVTWQWQRAEQRAAALAIAVENERLMFWEFLPGKRLRFPDQSRFSAHGRKSIVIFSNYTARVCNSHNQEPLTAAMKHGGPIRYVRFSVDEKEVVTASEDRTARVWDAFTGKPLSPPLQHTGAVNHAAFSADGRQVVTASEDRTARIWEVYSGRQLHSLDCGDSVVHARFSGDGKYVITMTASSKVKCWDAQTGRPSLWNVAEW